VRTAVEGLQEFCTLEIHDFVPLKQLQAIHRSCRVNLYMKSWRTFHHKVLELLAAGRPILSFPGETEEARRITKETGGTLFPCSSADEIGAVLSSCYESATPERTDLRKLDKFSWEAQAVKLVEILEESSKREKA
jgi:glycosyltransferase involved in cell wall biosynthesis